MSPALRRGRAWRAMATFLAPILILIAVTLPHAHEGGWRGDTPWYAALGLDAWRRAEPFALESGPGEPYFNKPPLAILAFGASLRAFGVNILAARIPSIIAAAVCVAATVGIARSLAGRRAGACTGCALALTYEFFRRTHEASLDLWQGAFVLSAAWCVAAAWKRQRPALILGAGVFIGLGLMCKPFMALAAIPALAAWLAVGGRARWCTWLLAAAAIAIVIALPWHLAMHARFGEAFIDQYLGREIFDRAGGALVGGQKREQRMTFYVEQIGRHSWPWLLPAALGFVALVRRRAGVARTALAWGAIWFGVWLVALSLFPDRRDRYAVPLHPGLAVLAGVWIARLAPIAIRRAAEAAMRWAGPAAIVGGIALALAPIRVHRADDPQWPTFFAFLRGTSATEIWEGASDGAPAARVYLETGRWPRPTRARDERPIADPPTGAMLFYHARGGRAPGAGERVVFTSGDLTVTVLDATPWSPRLIEDPGER